MARYPNFFRKPYGPGWALVGDAGYNKDPITAQGITDAFRDAELCATALDEAFSGRARSTTPWPPTSRPATRRCFRSTSSRRSWPRWTPPPPEMQQLLGAVHGNQQAMDAFVSINAGTVSPAEFFDPANIGRLLAPV